MSEYRDLRGKTLTSMYGLYLKYQAAKSDNAQPSRQSYDFLHGLTGVTTNELDSMVADGLLDRSEEDPREQ